MATKNEISGPVHYLRADRSKWKGSLRFLFGEISGVCQAIPRILKDFLALTETLP
jgi:hypothetical protein